MKKIAISFAMMVCAAQASAQGYVDLFLAPNDLGVKCAKWTDCKKERLGYGVRVGNAIHSDWLEMVGKPGVEIGYQRFGKVTSSGTKPELYFNGSTKPNVTNGPFRTIAVSTSATADAITAALTFGNELSAGVNVVGKLGMAYASATVSDRASDASSGSHTENHFAPLVGVGMDFQVYEGISLVGSAEFTRIKFDGQGSRVFFAVLGVRANF